MPPRRSYSNLRLKCYRNTAANHAEVVLRATNDIPAEVVHQTNGGREAHFEPAAELAHCLGFAAAIARTNDIAVRRENQFLTPATPEHRAGTGEGIRGKSAARNRIPKGKSAESRAGSSAFTAVSINIEENAVILIQRDCVTLEANAEIAMEKVFRINATTPSMIHSQICIVTPGVAGEGIRSPQVNIPLCIPIPLRTRRLLNRRLFHFLARRVGFGSAEREARERSRGTHHNCKFLHHSSLVDFLLVATTAADHRPINNATGSISGCARRRNSGRKTSFRGG